MFGIIGHGEIHENNDIPFPTHWIVKKNREYQGLMRAKLHGNHRNMLAVLEIGKISLGSNWKYLTEVTMNTPLEPGLPLGSKRYSRETLAYVQKERHKNVQFQHFI